MSWKTFQLELILNISNAIKIQYESKWQIVRLNLNSIIVK